MTREQMASLEAGDLVRHKRQGEALVVHRNDGDRVICVRTYVVQNPEEWDVVAKSGAVTS